jgi:hypothetical protein
LSIKLARIRQASVEKTLFIFTQEYYP